MDQQKFLYGIILFIIIIVVYRISSILSITNTGKNIIGGLWQGHPSFCNESGIDMFYIYFDIFDTLPSNKSLDLKKKGVKNMCWILMTNKDQVIVNHITTYLLSPRWLIKDNWSTDTSKPKCYNIIFGDIPEIMKDTFPKSQQVKMNINLNKIILADNDTAYFVGYKDSRISDLISLNYTDSSIGNTYGEKHKYDEQDYDKSDGSEEIIEKND